jgi:hypothetical protein
LGQHSLRRALQLNLGRHQFLGGAFNSDAEIISETSAKGAWWYSAKALLRRGLFSRRIGGFIFPSQFISFQDYSCKAD